MKWFKKIKEIFSKDDIYDDDNMHHEVEEDDFTETQYNDHETVKHHKAFKFPVVSEQQELSSGASDRESVPKSRKSEMIFDQLNATNSFMESGRQVYDVDEPRIRDLLANRGKNVKTERIIRSERVETIDTPPLKPVKPKPETIIHSQETFFQKIQPSSRGFKPTNVPSPIHGFTKPSQISVLLDQKKETEHQNLFQKPSHTKKVTPIDVLLKKQTNLEQTKGKTEEPLVETQQDEVFVKQHTYSQPNRQQSTQPPVVEQEQITPIVPNTIEINQNEVASQVQQGQIQEDSNDISQEISTKVDDLILFEADYITEEQQEELPHQDNQPVEINIDDLPHIVHVEVDESVTVELPVEEKHTTVKVKSTLPFNVMMLKSDKEKLMMKQLTPFKKVMTEKLNLDATHNEVAATAMKVEETTFATVLQPVMEEKQLQQQVALEQVAHEPVTKMNEEIKKEDENKDVKLQKSVKIYKKPSIDLLEMPEQQTQDTQWMEMQADKLVESLSYFQITAQIESVMQGPAVTQFEITVEQGTKVSKIRNLADDLKLALAAKDIRIQAPIPGKSSIGIEIPNRTSRAVRLSEVIDSEAFQQSDSPLEAALGLDLTGKPMTIDLRKMPHGLIAGATGSGKSVCINSILISLLYKAAPYELKLLLIDPKMVELAPFNHIPHLVSPVITDVKAATAALKWAVEEMERRYQLFAATGARDIVRFNKQANDSGEHGHKLPYILIVIDELADLMMMSPADVEEAICRIAQKARACGIHLIVATQRPSVDVITGLIKSNIPTRIAFAVSSQIDSRTILDSQGAERLLGRGDMLYVGNGMSDAVRIQGTFVTDDEIEAVIEHVREQGEPDYFFEQDELIRKTTMTEVQDELFEDVCRFIYEQGSASTSLIQRNFSVGYGRAARLVDALEDKGFISGPKGSKARDVFITSEDLSELFD